MFVQYVWLYSGAAVRHHVRSTSLLHLFVHVLTDCRSTSEIHARTKLSDELF